MVGEGAALLVKRALQAARREVDLRAALARFLELYDERLLAHTKVYEGIGTVLEQVHQRHQLAVLTNKPLRATRSILEGLGLARYFDQVFGGDGPHPRKPDPGALAAMMEAADSTPASTCMIGDSRIDLATARAAGTRIVLAGYGFGFTQEMPALEVDELVARTPADLPVAIERALRQG